MRRTIARPPPMTIADFRRSRGRAAAAMPMTMALSPLRAMSMRVMLRKRSAWSQNPSPASAAQSLSPDAWYAEIARARCGRRRPSTMPPKRVEIGRGLAALDPAADEAAEHAPEVLVPREGEEAPRIGEHADEAREEAEVRERRSWSSMPSIWSLNHQAEPSCILPGPSPSWKQPMTLAMTS